MVLRVSIIILLCWMFISMSAMPCSKARILVVIWWRLEGEGIKSAG